jgi:hypothetical protein
MFHDCNKPKQTHLCVCEMKEEGIMMTWVSCCLEFACQYSFFSIASRDSVPHHHHEWHCLFFYPEFLRVPMSGKKWERASAPFHPQEGYKITCNSLLTSMDNIIHLYSLIDLYTWMRRGVLKMESFHSLTPSLITWGVSFLFFLGI